jgi:predicted nucleic acid-binding protein
MRTVLVDSGAWIALLIRDDPHHREAAQFFSVKPTPVWVVTNIVLAETYSWLRYRSADPALAFRFVNEILSGEEAGRVEVFRPQRDVEIRAASLGRKFADVDLSWADLISFAACQELGVQEVFGFDQHFYLMGLMLLPSNV